MYLGTLLDTLFEGIAHHTFHSTSFCFLQELIVDSFMHVGT